MFNECRLQGQFTLSSGKKSTIYYDFDLLNTKETVDYTKLLLEHLPKELVDKIDFIASPALGGIEIAFLIAFALNKPRVKIDKEGLIRGPIFKNQHFLIVDDVITSYQAVNRVCKTLNENKCIGVSAFIYRGRSKDLSTEFPTIYLAHKEPEYEDSEIQEKCHLMGGV